jgi:tetratricopeptide (TPR) repeat protein
MGAFIFLELFTEEYRSSYEAWKTTNMQVATNYIHNYLLDAPRARSRGEYNSSAIENYNAALESHKSGDKKQALELYGKALAQEPRMMPALHNMSLIYLEMEETAKARETLGKWSQGILRRSLKIEAVS